MGVARCVAVTATVNRKKKGWARDVVRDVVFLLDKGYQLADPWFKIPKRGKVVIRLTSPKRKRKRTTHPKQGELRL